MMQAEMKAGFTHLGFPDYFRVELAVAKLLGAVALLAPLGPRIKEWAYAGFAITFVSAFVAHAASGDPVMHCVAPVVFLALLAVSYLAYHQRQAGRPQSVPAPRAEVAFGA